MRKAIIAAVVGCGIVAAAAPALACSFTQASSDQSKPQQTASAQDTSTTRSQ